MTLRSGQSTPHTLECRMRTSRPEFSLRNNHLLHLWRAQTESRRRDLDESATPQRRAPNGLKPRTRKRLIEIRSSRNSYGKKQRKRANWRRGGRRHRRKVATMDEVQTHPVLCFAVYEREQCRACQAQHLRSVLVVVLLSTTPTVKRQDLFSCARLRQFGRHAHVKATMVSAILHMQERASRPASSRRLHFVLAYTVRAALLGRFCAGYATADLAVSFPADSFQALGQYRVRVMIRGV